MKWCQSCVLPDTRPNLVIGADGICNACKSHGTKKVIDWAARAENLKKVVAGAKTRAAGYDCLIPVSGGKDSTWQVIKALELGLKPLAVTWKTPARTAIGQANLDALVNLGVDHIDYQISPKVEAHFMWRAFERFGDTGIPMHMSLFAIPLTLAVRMRIPLVVWGENSAFEYGAGSDAETGFKLDSKWLKTYGVTQGTGPEDWYDAVLTPQAMTAYRAPADQELETAGVTAIFLGYYLPWDPEETYRVARAAGFRNRAEGPKIGLWDYADIDDDFISIHHWMKWYKFGFTRLFDNLSVEIRNGRMTRDEALATIRKFGEQRPVEDIARFCAFAGKTEAEFYAAAETFRNQSVWRKDGQGRYSIPDFLLPDWTWS